MINPQQLLDTWVQQESSDLHITPPNPPFWRIHGDLRPMPDIDPMTEDDVVTLTRLLVDATDYQAFMATNELDCATTLPNGRRIRINVHRQMGLTGLALRLLPQDFYPLEGLGLPKQVCQDICALKQGLVLVTGATGSGKSTTLASFINQINTTRTGHIVTIEDPVEYKHSTKRCFVTQREIGADTASFNEALRRILREDPDYVLIGEMRDPETIRAALTIAETGHLTFGTLHTSTAVHTMTRIISSFPAAEQDQIRTQLAGSLKHVICQQLIPHPTKGRQLVAEILVSTPAVQALIRENRLHQIPSIMQTARDAGMVTMEQALGACR